MSDVTQILYQLEHGDPSVAEQLLPLVYEELRKLAAARLRNENPGHSLSATALVHEVYLRMVNVEQSQRWDSRGHFFAAAAEAMRRILVERARRMQTQKHGGKMKHIDLDVATAALQSQDEELLALDEALTRLEQQWPAKANVVKLRYFAGMTIPEAANAMGISTATTERYWKFARAWLHAELRTNDEV